MLGIILRNPRNVKAFGCSAWGGEHENGPRFSGGRLTVRRLSESVRFQGSVDGLGERHPMKVTAQDRNGAQLSHFLQRSRASMKNFVAQLGNVKGEYLPQIG